ncbi:MAG: Holliday junction branch migration protein RuvA [Nitrospirae bacterium]|nr:MAG: Holliday junction branch migration protein RuvA [Nitrospirota bacterium]
MISTLKGKLLKRSPEKVVVDVSGVGYEVKVPLSTLSELPPEGSPVFLYVHTSLRDDAIELYGFSKEEDRELFRKLLTVTGVGPRLALNILSGSSAKDLVHAIEQEDLGLLTRLPGVGRKTAQRILFELKERLPSAEAEVDRASMDALSALVNLGYKKSQASEAVKRAYNNGHRDVETILKEALKYLNR